MSQQSPFSLLKRRQQHSLCCISPSFNLFQKTIDQSGGYRLDEAALVLALEANPLLDTWACLKQLDRMGEALAQRLNPDMSIREAAETLQSFLCESEGFRGNKEEPFIESNNHLNEVLKSRLGNPISLSILNIEVGRRAGLFVRGVGLPGHFITRLDYHGKSLYMDPFDQGKIKTVKETHKMIKEMTEGEAPILPGALAPLGKRQILIHLLRNLKGTFLKNGQMARALAATQRILLLAPSDIHEIRDRGIIFTQLECYHSARQDLLHYLTHLPNGDDALLVRAHIEELSEAGYSLH